LCDLLDEFLSAVIAKKAPRLIIQAPPQHGKSELVSRRFPAYVLGKYPHLRLIACSYGAILAFEFKLRRADHHGRRAIPPVVPHGGNTWAVCGSRFCYAQD
jgi:hypothetical protein